MIDYSSYIHLTEGRQPLIDGQSRVYFCELNQYHSTNVFRSFSIKYTLEGAVEYRTDKEVYNLLPGYFLLSSQQPCACVVDSKPLTRNISIDMNRTLMEEVYTVMANKKEIDPDQLAHGHFASPDFFENIYPDRHSPLGTFLAQLRPTILQVDNAQKEISSELFYSLAEQIILLEFTASHSLHSLDSIKSSTRKETLRRLLNGKYFMDDHFLQNPSLPEVARHSHLSAYYFLRSFKKAFGVTPYQYILHKRLEFARSFVLQGESLTEIAEICGFTDGFSLSKAFKKFFGYSPSRALDHLIA